MATRRSVRPDRRPRRPGLSPRSVLVMIGIQLVVLGGAVYFFGVTHGAANRIFVGAIILAGLVNVSRFMSMYSASRRLRSGPARPRYDRPEGW